VKGTGWYVECLAVRRISVTLFSGNVEIVFHLGMEGLRKVFFLLQGQRSDIFQIGVAVEVGICAGDIQVEESGTLAGSEEFRGFEGIFF
jgi:hypothetical protein